MPKASKPSASSVKAPAKAATPKGAAEAPAKRVAPKAVNAVVASKPVIVKASKPVTAAPVAPATLPEIVQPVITPAVEETATIIEKETKIMTTKTATAFTDINSRAKAAIEKGTKMFEEANEFGKGNVEAVVESAKIAAKGFETMGQDAAEYGRKSFETATATLKSFSSIKTPAEFFKLQSDFVRGAFDAMVAQSSASTEAMLKLAGEVAQPISSRAALAAEKIKLAA